MSASSNERSSHVTGPRSARSRRLMRGRLRQRRSQAGFTLIELLVVIVILGILSAVVVFAVRGAGDKGKGAAVATDARTIRTAQEAYCAKAGQYATMDQLTGTAPAADGNTYKFLSEPSEYHALVNPAPPGDRCNNTNYEIKCKDPNLTMPDCGGTPNPIAPPTAKWVRTSTDPSPIGGDGRAVTLSDGKVLVFFHLGLPPPATPIAQIYDPALDTWTPTAPPIGSATTISATLIKGTFEQCGINCNKVLVQMFSHQNIPWQLYDPLTGTWVPAGVTISTKSLGANPVLLTGDRCKADCGKVLLVGGNTTGGNPVYTAELYDPKLNLWTEIGNMPTAFSGPIAMLLSGPKCAEQCGKVLIAGPAQLTFIGIGIAVDKQPNATDLLFDPADRSWTPLPDRQNRCTTCSGESFLLPDGRVLSMTAMRIFDPAENAWGAPLRRAPGCEGSCGFGSSFTLLADGRVLKVGDQYVNGSYPKQTYLFDPDDASWVPAGPTNLPRYGDDFPIGILLVGPNCGDNCNKVLVAGGPEDSWGTAELYG